MPESAGIEFKLRRMSSEAAAAELVFPVSGSQLPSDHAYQLYGAICAVVPEMHNDRWLGIHSITGIKRPEHKIALVQNSHLRLRFPFDRIELGYKLAGRKLVIGNHQIRCGIPEIYLLRPHAKLKARIVIVNSSDLNSSLDPEIFLRIMQKQLERINVSATVNFACPDAPERRALKIKGVTQVGYSLMLNGLSDDDSLRVQALGLGGRRKFGCGLFVPITSNSQPSHRR